MGNPEFTLRYARVERRGKEEEKKYADSTFFHINCRPRGRERFSSDGEISFAMEIMQTAQAAKLKRSPNSPSELCLRGLFNVVGHVMRRSGSPHRTALW